MKYTIAIDLGGTVVKIGLLYNGGIIDCIRLESERSMGLKSNLPRIKKAVEVILSRKNIGLEQISGIGLAFPGLVDPTNNRVISTNEKYDDACSFDLEKWAKENWDIPFHMDNDARLAVIGEWYQGAARGKNNVVMMTIGTGIGTGVVIDGKVLYGQHFQAGSLGGHFVLDYKGRSCSCGNKGCAEALASSFFLPVIIRQHPDLSDSFKEMAGQITFKEIFQMATDGDDDALLLRNECMDVWSAAIITYIHAYDPEVLILGGGVMNSAEVIIPYIKEKVYRLAWCPSEKVPIVPAELSENAALLGLEYRLTHQ
ncbi:glucokinase [Parabacteroides sp. PF5-5]|uniref:ROK family protein n=1 Tax=unclassified Parabacteroides TaxID=2649774 RepID=UPI002475FDE8|nr:MULTISPECIES: ROK family protein [unclassified Parabacteroides]MDH6306528.1 glucokinase [Parabacteroides sp. PH5-39]MDH6317495.1 glucokinase [Parabacteroides sp. PF5-13]MDH6321202.1 glucokinase [Parabacteroides sp. PH5-13]MDH6324934.1 glucokinase [Parabacteroides sp. PH5-8]MDH6328643.1 glucokinase [Parabacteroides sp. PH5-41]